MRELTFIKFKVMTFAKSGFMNLAKSDLLKLIKFLDLAKFIAFPVFDRFDRFWLQLPTPPSLSAVSLALTSWSYSLPLALMARKSTSDNWRVVYNIKVAILLKFFMNPLWKLAKPKNTWIYQTDIGSGQLFMASILFSFILMS